MAKYHITIVRPEGYAHSECFREIAESLEQSLKSLGHAAAIGEHSLDAQATNIILGAHLLTEEEAQSLFPSTILYNLEQIGGAKLPPWYLGLASRHRVWEYSRLNLERWQQLPCVEPPALVEVGYAPVLRRIEPAPVQDVDVLFYGSLNERRQRVLQELQAAGLAVHHVFGVYGPERDALIARAKVVLNVHYYETEVFEIVRVSYLLANAKAVVSELSPDMTDLSEALAICGYDDLVERCVALVANEAERRELATRGAALFARRSQAEILRAVIGEARAGDDRHAGGQPAPAAHTAAQVFPRRLNLGSGKDWREDCLNIDINDYWRPDAVLDISQELPSEFELETERFGTIQIKPGSFDEILANDVLEHIPNLTRAMTRALDLLSVGGKFHINVPYDLSWGGWQDPTHVRAFNERSWLYYTDWFWYLGWTEARFHLDNLEFVLSPIGQRLQGTVSGEDLLRSPRAVDSMRVTLRKQLLSVDETRFVASYLRRPERVLTLADRTSATERQGVPGPLAKTTAQREAVTSRGEVVMEDSNLGKWDGWYAGMGMGDIGAFRYSDTETYRMAADFLSDLTVVEDWGCGAGGFKRFCKSPYVGLDGSKTPFADKIVDFCNYRSSVDGVMMRHVLEHNYEWEKVLTNAVASANKKMCLVLFTPFQTEGTKEIAHNKQHGVDVPDLAFRREDVEKLLVGCEFTSVSLATPTGYGVEHIYLITKKKRVCVISANLGNLDACNMSKHVHQDLPAGWSMDHFNYNSTNTKLRDAALHPRMQAKIYKMFGWQLHPGYDYYVWLDAAFVVSSAQSIKWMLDSCGDKDLAMFRHPKRNSIKSEVEFCLSLIQIGDKYVASRYGSEPLEEQVNHYYREAELASSTHFSDSLLIAAGAFCYKPTQVVKETLQDWYLECCRWSCQDQLSLPVVLQRHGINPVLFDAEIFSNPYLSYVWRGSEN